MLLIIYQNEVMKEVLLPIINNSDYEVYIDKNNYSLKFLIFDNLYILSFI